MMGKDERVARNGGNKALADRRMIFHILLLVIMTVPYALFLANKGMPISEGWYTEFAWQINHGKIPYRDFALLFPPLYPMFISLVTRLFGYDVIVLRMVGIIFFFVEAFLIYRILSCLFDADIALVSAIPSVYFIHYGVVDMIMYDVTYFLNILVFLSVLFALRSIDANLKTHNDILTLRNAMVSGLFAACAVMTKQSTGIAVAVVLLCVYLGGGAILRLRTMYKAAAAYATGVGLIIALTCVYLFCNGAFFEFVDSCILRAAGAKGGLGVELVSWVIRSGKQLIFSVPAALLLTALSLIGVKTQSGIKGRRVSMVLLAGFSALVVLGTIVCYRHQGFSQTYASIYNADMMTAIIFISVALLFIHSIYYSIACFREGAVTQSEATSEGLVFYKLLTLTGSVFGSGWACGMSGGLANSQVALGMGLLICMIWNSLLAINRNQLLLTIAAPVLSLAIVLFVVSSRFHTLYYWWGLDEGSVWDQVEYTNVPNLKHIKMSSKDVAAYEGIYSISQKYLNDGDSVFVFPHCPIMYSVAGVHAETYSVVQWFDVSDAESLRSDMEHLEEELPKLIVFCEIPEDVMSGHEDLFGSHHTREMQNSLKGLLDSQYFTVGQYDMGNGYLISVAVRQ